MTMLMFFHFSPGDSKGGGNNFHPWKPRLNFSFQSLDELFAHFPGHAIIGDQPMTDVPATFQHQFNLVAASFQTHSDPCHLRPGEIGRAKTDAVLADDERTRRRSK